MSRRENDRMRVRLVHWNDAEARQRAARLAALGCEVEAGAVKGTGCLRELRNNPPDAIVIDLSRIPSQGRDVALALRQYKATRRVPLVFVGGEPAKVEGVRALLPDATFATWAGIGRALSQAVKEPLADPVVPSSSLAGYSGRPLVIKLGLKPDSTVALLGAPEGFRDTLVGLPPGVRFADDMGDGRDLAIWFCRSRAELTGGIADLTARLGRGSLWIAWPKKASPLASDISQREVRATGLAAGLVDYKVCAIDETWSGLLFTRRKGRRA